MFQEVIDRLFMWVNKEVESRDLTDFFTAYANGDIDDSVPQTPDIIKAVKMAKDAGAKLTDTDDMYNAIVHFVNKIMTEAKEADEKAVVMKRLEETKKKADEEARKKAEETKPLKTWQKGIIKEETPVQTNGNTDVNEEIDLGSEDLRKWSKIDLQDEVIDLVDAAHKRHGLNFRLGSEKTADNIDRFMARVEGSGEPVTKEILARWVDTKFKRIGDSAHAADRVRDDLNGVRVNDDIFDLLIGMAKAGTYSSDIAKGAIKLDEEKIEYAKAEAILDRTVLYKGDFVRAYRKVMDVELNGKITSPTTPSKPKKTWEK